MATMIETKIYKGRDGEVKEIIKAIDMTEFDKAKATQTALDKATSRLGAVLKTFPREADGLLTEETRKNADYQQARTEFKNAFKAYQSFNTEFARKYKKEIRAAFRAKYCGAE